MGKGPSPFAERNSPVNMGVKLDPNLPATNPRRVKPTICPAWQPKNTTFDLGGPRVYGGNQRGRVFVDQQDQPPAALHSKPSANEETIEELERANEETIEELERAIAELEEKRAAAKAKIHGQEAR